MRTDYHFPAKVLALAAVATWSLAGASALAGEPSCDVAAGQIVSTTNDGGETLTAWDDSCIAKNDSDLLRSAAVLAVTGSMRGTFENLGAITPSTALASTEAASLDDAGDGWISGTNSVFTRYEQSHDTLGDAMYAPHGGWIAFRPAGRSFRPARSLPGGAQVESTSVSGNAAGDALVTWTTPTSIYLAWSTPAGGLKQIERFRASGQPRILGAGVDRHGGGIVILSEGSGPFDETIQRAVAIRGVLGRPFRPPAAILTPAHYRRRHLSEYFETPAVAITEGTAYLATTAAWATTHGEESNLPSRSLLVGVPSAGRMKTLPGLHLSLDDGIVADPHGHVLLVGGENELEAIDAKGHSHPLGSLPKAALPIVAITSNAHGQVVIGLQDDHHAYGITMNITGSRRHAVNFATQTSNPSVAATIDAHGDATLFWSEEDSTGDSQTLYAHALTPGGPPIQAAYAAAPTNLPTR